MTICYFGIYKPTYTRNAINIRGLRRNGVEVLECNSRQESNRKFWQLVKQYWLIRKKFKVIIVGFPGHTIMPLAWVLAKLTGKKIIFDAFVSMYDSMVFDRQQFSAKSLKAKKYWLIDWLSCQLADIILLDANAHAQYFIDTFRINPKKFKRLLVGVDDEEVKPVSQKKVTEDFLVHFHGTYIPAQGIAYIIEAAKILKEEPISFNLVGRLTDYHREIEFSKQNELKVNFFDFMPYKDLIEKISEADICLGMFGDTDKAKRAGAFKVVESMAMEKAFVTGDTAAMREFLVDGRDCLFCKIADAKDLAEKILVLKNNEELRQRLAKQGYQRYLELLTPKVLGKELKEMVEKLVA